MLLRITAATALTLLVGCAPAGPAPTAQPATSAPKAAQASPAQAAKTAEKPEAKAPEAWQQEWERVLAAARQEGKVSVMGPGGDDLREALTVPFEAKYGLSVDFFGGPGRSLMPRLTEERAAGLYTWDIYISGSGNFAGSTLEPKDLFDPLEPALILPEVRDPKNWRGGAMEFFDEERTLFQMSPTQLVVIYVNPNLVSPNEFKSYKDLLDPKWKGKIVMDSPLRPGPGQARMLFFYLHPELGPEFIRALGRQEITIMEDYRQEFDALATGRFPVLLAGSDSEGTPLISRGLPIHMVDPTTTREGGDVNSGSGAIGLFKPTPHPNAAKVYANWLLSKEGQIPFVQARGYISARLDVPTDHTDAWKVPKPGAVRTDSYQALLARQELIPLVRQVFGI